MGVHLCYNIIVRRGEPQNTSLTERIIIMTEKKTVTLDKETLEMLIYHAYTGAYAKIKRQKEIDEITMKKHGHHNEISQVRIEQLDKDIDTLDELYKKYKTL